MERDPNGNWVAVDPPHEALEGRELEPDGNGLQAQDHDPSPPDCSPVRRVDGALRRWPCRRTIPMRSTPPRSCTRSSSSRRPTSTLEQEKGRIAEAKARLDRTLGEEKEQSDAEDRRESAEYTSRSSRRRARMGRRDGGDIERRPTTRSPAGGAEDSAALLGLAVREQRGQACAAARRERRGLPRPGCIRPRCVLADRSTRRPWRDAHSGARSARGVVSRRSPRAGSRGDRTKPVRWLGSSARSSRRDDDDGGERFEHRWRRRPGLAASPATAPGPDLEINGRSPRQRSRGSLRP